MAPIPALVLNSVSSTSRASDTTANIEREQQPPSICGPLRVSRAVLGAFASGFASFIGDESTSDCTVVVSSSNVAASTHGSGSPIMPAPNFVEYKLHRLMLAHASPFFRKAFMSGMKERATARVEWGFPDPRGVFATLMQYTYGAEIQLAPTNAIALAVLAHQLQMEEFQNICVAYVKDTLGTDTAQKYFEAAIEFSESAPLGLLQLLADFICDNMDRFVDLNLNKLSLNMFMSMLSSDALNTDEDTIFYLVRSYVSSHPTLSAQEQSILWNIVRMPFVSLPVLKLAQETPSFPKESLMQSMMKIIETKTKELRDLEYGPSAQFLWENAMLPDTIRGRSATSPVFPFLAAPGRGQQSSVQSVPGSIGATKETQSAFSTERQSMSQLSQLSMKRRMLELKRYTKEPDLSGGGWTVKGDNHDVLCFAVDKEITVWGIGALQGPSTQILEITAEISQESRCLCRLTTTYTSTGRHSPVQILFKQPLPVKPGQLYTVDVVLRGQERLFSVHDGAEVCKSHGVTFYFSETSRSTNGTRVSSGQIPSLYFRIVHPPTVAVVFDGSR